jgi:hypothetical protein
VRFFARVAILVGWWVRDLAVLFLHLLTTVARLAGPGGARSVVAESVLVMSKTRSRAGVLFVTGCDFRIRSEAGPAELSSRTFWNFVREFSPFQAARAATGERR